MGLQQIISTSQVTQRLEDVLLAYRPISLSDSIVLASETTMSHVLWNAFIEKTVQHKAAAKRLHKQTASLSVNRHWILKHSHAFKSRKFALICAECDRLIVFKMDLQKPGPNSFLDLGSQLFCFSRWNRSSRLRRTHPQWLIKRGCFPPSSPELLSDVHLVVWCECDGNSTVRSQVGPRVLTSIHLGPTCNIPVPLPIRNESKCIVSGNAQRERD